MTIPAAILDLPVRTPELSECLIRWCNQNSGSRNSAGLQAMLGLLEKDFGLLGKCERVPLTGSPVPALRMRIRPEAGLQVFLSGHFDTVYDSTDPFQSCATIGPDRLRGPGVIDMKGGLVVMRAVLATLANDPAANGLGCEVLLNPDEEIGSFATAPVLAEAAGRHRLGLVFEPARPDGSLVRSRKGTGNFTITAHGRAAHAASAARDGRNAIAALAEFLTGAVRLPDEMPGVLLNVGQIRGGGPATNVVPDFAEALLDVRVTSAPQRSAIRGRLEELAGTINRRPGFRLDIGGDFNRPPMEASDSGDEILRHWQTCASDLGLPPPGAVHAGGASDANLLSAAGLPCLDGLGPIGDRLHSPEEWVQVSSLAQRAQVAALFLHRTATRQIPLPGGMS
ncbi:MAG TPA: hydrolase [Candidatus Didemnitutus sp.]